MRNIGHIILCNYVAVYLNVSVDGPLVK